MFLLQLQAIRRGVADVSARLHGLTRLLVPCKDWHGVGPVRALPPIGLAGLPALHGLAGLPALHGPLGGRL